MVPFELAEPESLAEAVTIARSRGQLGTSDRRRHRADADDEVGALSAAAPGLLAEGRLPAWPTIRIGGDGSLEIGAMVRLADLRRSTEVRDAAPVIAETLLTHSNVRVRNVATIGGNLAHADPHMDLPPVLIALGARVSAVGPAGETGDRGRGSVHRLSCNRADQQRADHFGDRCRRRPAGAPPISNAPLAAADDWPALGLAVSFAHRAPHCSPCAHRGRRGDRNCRCGCPEPRLCSRVVSSTTRCCARPAGPRRPRRRWSPTSTARLPTSVYLVEVHLRRAIARIGQGAVGMSETTQITSGQIGRSLPRVEARAKVTGSAEYIHNLRLPGMLHAKICRSAVPHGRIRPHRYRAPPRPFPVCSASSPPTISARSLPTPITAPRFTTSRSWPRARCAMSASRSRRCSLAIRMSRNRRRRRSKSTTSRCPPYSTRSRRSPRPPLCTTC